MRELTSVPETYLRLYTEAGVMVNATSPDIGGKAQTVRLLG